MDDFEACKEKRPAKKKLPSFQQKPDAGKTIYEECAEKCATDKRFVVIYVTDEYSKRAGNINSYIYEYDKCNLELKSVGSKQMILVSNKDGENELLIDADAVIAIDYNIIIAL